jgi:DNA primase
MRHLHVRSLPSLRHVTIRQKTGIGDYLVADTAESLVALVQMDVLEVHTWNARVDDLERPDRVIFDLDPYVDYLRNCRAATAIALYSTRATPLATVSSPVGWDELTPQFRPDALTVQSVLSGLRRPAPDPWGGYDSVKQRLRGSTIRALQRS